MRCGNKDLLPLCTPAQLQPRVGSVTGTGAPGLGLHLAWGLRAMAVLGAGPGTSEEMLAKGSLLGGSAGLLKPAAPWLPGWLAGWAMPAKGSEGAWGAGADRAAKGSWEPGWTGGQGAGAGAAEPGALSKAPPKGSLVEKPLESPVRGSGASRPHRSGWAGLAAAAGAVAGAAAGRGASRWPPRSAPVLGLWGALC